MTSGETYKISWRSSLIFRSLSLILIMLAFIMATAGWFSISNLKKQKIETLNKESEYVGHITALALSLPMWNLDNAQVAQQLDALKGSVSFCGARIFDTRDQIFAKAY